MHKSTHNTQTNNQHNKLILQLDHLTKTYDQSTDSFTLGPINLSLYAGSVLGVLGKNGAGKTTFFQLITGNLDASSGKIYFHEQRLTPESYLLKRSIGYLPQNLDLPRWITAKEALSYAAALYEFDKPHSHVEKALNYWHCADFASRPLAACSHGMQKRIGLALATIHDPDFLVLDEPFSGLDLYHIKALKDCIQNRQHAQKLTIICTHIAPYAAELCQNILFINQGKPVWVDQWTEQSFMERIQLIEQYFYGT